MSTWTLAPALEQLRRELNARWPNRDHASDGAIGDAAHAHTASDHNPNAQGVVCAYDIDTDLDGTDDSNDPEMDALVEWLRLHPHPTLKYVLYRANDPRFGMYSAYAAHGYPPFMWRPYTKDPHISHPHISVGQGPDGQSAPGTYDDTSPWLDGFGEPQEPPQQEDDMNARAIIHDSQGHTWIFRRGDNGMIYFSRDGGSGGNRIEGSSIGSAPSAIEVNGVLIVGGKGSTDERFWAARHNVGDAPDKWTWGAEDA